MRVRLREAMCVGNVVKSTTLQRTSRRKLLVSFYFIRKKVFIWKKCIKERAIV